MPGLVPCLVGPGQVPVFTDPRQVTAEPTLAALSVAFHGLKPKVIEAFKEGIEDETIDRAHAARTIECTINLAPPAIRKLLEETLATTDWPVNSDFAKLHFGQGKAEGQAELLIDALELRGLTITDGVRRRITDCGDPELLREWHRRAMTATGIDEIFD
ncbi:hypothetical protein ACIBF1_31390 [Spirillospora sp. NPDC050679]